MKQLHCNWSSTVTSVFVRSENRRWTFFIVYLRTQQPPIVDLGCWVFSSTNRSSTQVHIVGFHYRLTPLGCRSNRWLTWSGSFYGLPWSKGLFRPFVCHSLQPPLQANFSMPSQFEDQKRLFEARHAGYILFWSAPFLTGAHPSSRAKRWNSNIVSD